ncbi:hypothetical protein D9757_010637 [Collybiopsis confluens]|uniref:Uncharacterized protein n=1 Tax=Collybiopsis confluens TaxID=2823264 RepID=A0A8H5GSP7_9AGAR|nr:hypothetical protein D9757_010637 [Collybiopsis confluens]
MHLGSLDEHFVVWGGGPALNESQLTQWCQLRPEFDPKRLDNLGPFDYAFIMLENDRRINPQAPALHTFLNRDEEPEAVFILRTVFAPCTSAPPDLTPTPKTRKAAGFWLQSEKLGQINFPYRCFLFEDISSKNAAGLHYEGLSSAEREVEREGEWGESHRTARLAHNTNDYRALSLRPLSITYTPFSESFVT